MITRKVFLSQLAGGGFALVLGGCGGGGGDSSETASADPAPGPDPTGCGNFSFSANHGHLLWIPAADLDSTLDKSYDVQGTSSHTHLVTLSAAQLAQLKAGQAIQVTTSLDASHTHDVSGGCV